MGRVKRKRNSCAQNGKELAKLSTFSLIYFHMVLKKFRTIKVLIMERIVDLLMRVV